MMNFLLGIAVMVLASLSFAAALVTPPQLPLQIVDDVPLTGKATRFDYQSFDATSGRLYIAHLGDDMLTVFDTKTRKIIADIKDLKRIHGVLAVPGLHRVYATVTGTNELVVIDDETWEITTRIPTGDYPDSLAYADRENKLYVSDLHGKTETVIDAGTNQVVATIQLNAPAGNPQYDAVSDRIFVAVHKLDQLVEIDPNTDKIVGNYPLVECTDSHGLLIDSKNRLAFAACEGNAKLVEFDLEKKQMTAIYPVGDNPDGLALDAELGQLYISSESGILTIFKVKNNVLKLVGKDFFALNAHTIAVDSERHRVYFPLVNVNGNPVLRIATISDIQGY